MPKNSGLSENNQSLVFKLIYKNTSFLFTGDIEEESEQFLVKTQQGNLKADVLKVAHHGSKTSSTESFLISVIPQFAIIQAGRQNRYHHPHGSVINRFETLGIQVSKNR